MGQFGKTAGLWSSQTYKLTWRRKTTMLWEAQELDGQEWIQLRSLV